MPELAKAAKKDGQDDGLSMTSTSEENEDTDEFFSFDRILAERKIDGNMMYLVEWEDSPLSKATWEPPAHFEPVTFSKWEEFKKKSGRRTALDFNIGDWKKAIHDELTMKRARHEARNIKRQSSGRQPTDFQNSWEEYLKIIEKSLEEFEEPHEETIVVKGSSSADDTSARESRHTDVPQAKDPVAPLQNQPRAPSPKPPAPRPHGSGEDAPVAQKSPVNQPRRQSFTREKPTSPPSLTTSPRQRKPLTLARTTTTAMSRQPPPVSRDANVGTNVFVGGKTRKDRPTILDAVSDTSKEPKMLRHRHQNIVRKRLRDREGLVAPAFPQTRLVALRGSSSSLARSGSATDPGMGTEATTDDAHGDRHESSDIEMAPDLPQKAHSPEAVPGQPGAASPGPSGNQTGENRKKRRRSVRWDDTVTVMKAPEAREEASLSPLAAPETMRSGNRSEGLESQSIPILCQLGASEANQLIMTFDGLPERPDLPWLQHFSNQALMVFTHSCTVQNFSSKTELPDKHLCRGLISSATGDERFESIARRLRSSCLGLLCHNGDYCVLAFASEGEGVTGEHGIDPGVLSSCPLKYSVIKPSTFLNPTMLAPLTCVGPDAGSMQEDVPVFDTFFNFEFDQLLPPSAGREDRHNFFLAFPPSARQETRLISQWLRYFDADCDIRTSLHAGSWSAFLKLGRGTLILHEDVIWAIRQFPSLATLLRAPPETLSFFLFKRAEPLLCTPPSRDLSSLDGGIGRTQLCPIFRPGSAFLVTPSFLASQPEQAYAFVKWFWHMYSRSSQAVRRGKLVVCSDIEDWTHNLVVKTRVSDEEFQRHGARSKWAESRFKTLRLLKTLVADSIDETDGLVVFAPDVINGSDEQSLVNWFGWWAIMNMDKLRKFTVIGSGNQHPARLALRIQLPQYHTDATEEPQQPASENHGDSATHQGQGTAWQLVYNDGAMALAGHIGQVEEAIHKEAFRPLAVYRYPVSYWHPDMAYHFTDYKSEYKTFKEWLNFFPDFVNVGGRKCGMTRGIYNSFAGLFYTIEGAFDRTKYPQGVKPSRRPWVAILRPANPHWRPWSTGELFIWDSTAWAQHPGDSAVHLTDLICAQRELVKLIQEESQSTFELPLQRVWLGGSTADCGGHRYSEPLDLALNWLASLPKNIRTLVPAPNNRIAERNWKEVLAGHGPGKPAEATATIPMDEDLPEGEVRGPKSMIFRAPRADGEAWRPDCRNLLHDWAERTRRLNKSAVRADYCFQPTMKWYNEQVQKGQGLSHLDVSPWNAIFSRLKISDPKDVPDQG